MTFIDYGEAFYSVNTSAVMEASKKEGNDETYQRLMDNINEECTGMIIFHKQSDKFPIRKGVRQRDTISPNLFTACLESIFRKLDWVYG